MTTRTLGLRLLCIFVLAACTPQFDSTVASMEDPVDLGEPGDEADDELEEEVPGDPSDEPWFDDADPEVGWGDVDLSCAGEQDCNDDETCLNGVCQIDRCSAAGYTSAAPLGDSFLFYADREVAVADADAYEGGYYADMYSPSGSVVEYDGSFSSGGEEILDLAGGDFLGDGFEGYATLMAYGTGGIARLLGGDEEITVSLPFDPVAMDAGDLDGDGRAEIVAISEDSVRICDFVDETCEDIEVEGQLYDVAVADVDGDGILEPIFLLEADGGWLVRVENLDADRTGQPADYTTEVDLAEVERISAGDLDGDGRAEVALLDDKGVFGTRDDHVFLLGFSEEEGGFQDLGEFTLDYGRLKDIALGDMDADGVAELVVLDEYNKLISYRYEDEALELLEEREIAVTMNPSFLALGDHDGDSPRAELAHGPEVVSGAQVPIVLLYLPPFSYEYSSGFSYGGYGLGETYSETYTDTVSLSINADVGVRAEFLSVFKTSFTEKVAWKTSQTLGTSSSLATGGRSSLRSDPDTFGTHYGAVVVSWGCFHAYTYEVVDPSGHYGDADGEPIVLTVPVDGGTAMLSTNRYNAMAEIVGDLPEMPVPYQVGDPTTYPTSPETIHGDPIPDEDYVFPGLTWYEVSDVGYVGWFNQIGESSSESTTSGLDLGASANVTVAGVSVGAGFTAGWGQGYSVSMGETALFMGGIPPFVDDPSTPADEYVDNFYRVAPVVYRQEYTDVEGNQSRFFVSTYVVDL